VTRRLALVAGALVLVLVGGWLAIEFWRGHNVGPVQRGFRVAEEHGCFTCHGPGGLKGYDDAEGSIGGVPPFTQDEVRGHAKSVDEIREWILDGMPKRMMQEPPEPDEGAVPVITMPAWREVLSAREVEDLVAYVVAVSDFEPGPEGQALAGRDAAVRLGCFQCHGPQGRGNPPNAGSLKGYIPSWDGPDYPELVKDDAELREWIRDGSPLRLREHRIASHFLRKQGVKMPAYHDAVKDEELAAIGAYIQWMRKGS
jgi:mono/diheme cytochrome c family protein